MYKNKNFENYEELTKKLLNEMSEMDIIYDEVQTGPQEEMTFEPYKLDLNKFEQYRKNLKKKKRL